MKNESIANHVAAILDELEQYKAQLENELAKTKAEIDDTDLKIHTFRGLQHNGILPFSGLRTQLAILKLFATHRPGPISRTEIANRLLKDGLVLTSKVAYTQSVSVALNILRKKEEVVSTDLGWDITQKGLEAWEKFNKKQTTAELDRGYGVEQLNEEKE